jgi:hypothetical protein
MHFLPRRCAPAYLLHARTTRLDSSRVLHVTTVVGPRKNYDPPALRHVLAPYTRPAGPLGIPYDHLLGRQGSALARAHVRNLIEALDALRFPGLLVLLVDHAELLDLEGASKEAADLGLVD